MIGVIKFIVLLGVSLGVSLSFCANASAPLVGMSRDHQKMLLEWMRSYSDHRYNAEMEQAGNRDEINSKGMEAHGVEGATYVESNDENIMSVEGLLSVSEERDGSDYEYDANNAAERLPNHTPPSFDVNENITGVIVDLSSWNVRSVSDLVMLRENSPEDILWRKGMVPLKERRSRKIGWGVSEKSIASSVIDKNPVTIWPVDMRVRGGGKIQELYIANTDLAELKSQNVLNVMESGNIVFLIEGAKGTE